MDVLELIIVIVGLSLTRLLFNRFPILPETGRSDPRRQTVSVIIPARNETRNLPLILGDLARQTVKPLEVIVADDASTDETSAIARTYNTTVLTLEHKPEDWIGKSWACQHGADAASGHYLLFLDADVRLGEDGLDRLLAACGGCTLSVQPWHETQQPYEQFSLIFNLIQAAANGTTLPRQTSSGLYGPVILMPREAYDQIGGHESVRRSNIEDMALGRQLKSHGLPFKLYIGDQAVRYRMYAGGMRDLLEGWTKNMAWGAAVIPFWHFLMVFLWITSMTSVPLHLLIYSVSGNLPGLVVYGILYLVWTGLLFHLSRYFIKSEAWAIIFYPLILTVTLLIFLISLVKKCFNLKISWKGRSIKGTDL